MVNVIIYARVSSKKLKHKAARQDVGRQISDLTSFANSKGWRIEGKIEEYLSGAISNRPGIVELFKIISSKSIDKVLVTDADRFGRRISDVFVNIDRLTDHKVSLFVLNVMQETLDDNHAKSSYYYSALPFFAAQAEYFLKQHSDRIKSGILKHKLRNNGRLIRSRPSPLKNKVLGLIEGKNLDEISYARIAEQANTSRQYVHKIVIKI